MLFANNYRDSNKDKRSNLTIVIGTGGAMALEYSISQNISDSGGAEAPEITNFIELPRDPMPAVEEKALLFSIRRDIDEIGKMVAEKRPDKVVIVLTSPWYFSQTKTITVERTEQFKIDKNLLDQLLEEEREIFLNRASGQFEISENDSVKLLETSVMRALLNGYEIGSFLEKSAKHLRLSIYISMTLSSLASELNSIAEEKFNPKKIILHSSPYVIFKAASPALEVDSAGAVIIDIENEITDIVIIRDGIISETLSFGRGLNFILRRIAGAYSMTPAEAISHLKILSDNHMSENHQQKFAEIVVSAMKEWQKMLLETLRHAAESRLLPNRFILMGGGAEFGIFPQYINNEETKGLIYKTAPLDIESLYPKYFRGRLQGAGKCFGGGPFASLLFLSVFSPEQIL